MGVVREDALDEAVYGWALGFGVPGGVDLDVGEEVGRVGLQLAGLEIQDAVQDVDAVEWAEGPRAWGRGPCTR